VPLGGYKKIFFLMKWIGNLSPGIGRRLGLASKILLASSQEVEVVTGILLSSSSLACLEAGHVRAAKSKRFRDARGLPFHSIPTSVLLTRDRENYSDKAKQ
jgi:hypothetical protein